MPLDITGLAASSALTEAFDLTGKLPLKLDETVVPIINVGDLSDDIFGPRAGCQLTVAAGGAANVSQTEISLPQTGQAQGAMIRVESVTLTTTVNTGALYHIGPSPGLPLPTAMGVTAWFDVGRRGLPYGQFAGKNDAPPIAGFVSMHQIYLRQWETQLVPLNWILRANPNTGLQQGLMIRLGTLNESARISVIWRERLPR